MRWFFALNQESNQFLEYADMIKVAVHTAQRHTSLVPHCLYDGEECELTEWLRRNGVAIIPCRSRFYEQLAALAQERGDPNIRTIGAGAFLRVEIPRLALEHGFANEVVLYTDCDVMFLDEVVPDLERIRTRFLAVAPEYNQTDYLIMNSGVMLMNLASLARRDADFTKFTFQHLALFTAPPHVWDQSAYQRYYCPTLRLMMQMGINELWLGRFMRRLRPLVRPQWDSLPLAFNWKPYWGDPDRAKILHFHGPKPYQHQIIVRNENPAFAILKPMVTESYVQMSELWERHLAEVQATTA